MTPAAEDLWFLPLGGCGEIGMNMNLYGHDDQWLMVDCGVTFRDQDGSNKSGYAVQMADPAFIVEKREQLQAILLTHAHEDHIGAVPHLWRKLQCPIYATRFTVEMLGRKLREHGLQNKVEIKIVEPGDVTTIGVFDIEWIPHTHSIPDPCGLVIRTPVGSVFHTADWKLDPNPLVGHHYHSEIYQSIGQRGVKAMVCDSTCADQPGSSLSESTLYDGLYEQIAQAEGRVVVTCFGSNIARLHTLLRIADDTHRHIGLLGRSLINTATAAKACQLLPGSSFVESEHLAYLPRETLLLVATGSQGEPRTALHRLSTGSFKDLELEAGDTVIFSARAIPGNELDIASMMNRLTARGIHTITPETSSKPIHASGHPSQDELKQLYQWINPTVVIPVHGEAQHQSAQVAFAKSLGIKQQLNGRNGDLFVISPTVSIRRQVLKHQRLGLGKKSLEKIPASFSGVERVE